MGLTQGSELLKRTAVESFWNGAFGTPMPYDGLYYQRSSTQETDTYAYLGDPDMPTEFVGDRNFKVVPEQTTTITNKFWDTSVAVDKKHIEFENIPEVAKLARRLGEKAMAHRHSLLSTSAAAGSASTDTVDGQNFFDTDHTDPGASYTTNQDNDLTAGAATNTQPTDLEFAASIRSCFDAFIGFKDGAGDPIEINMDGANFVVVVPPVYHSVAMRVMNADTLTGPVANDVRGRFRVVTDQFSTSTAAYHMYYVGGAHRPYILQMSGGIELNDYIDPVSGNYRYSATWVGNVGYGEWRTGILFTFT